MSTNKYHITPETRKYAALRRSHLAKKERMRLFTNNIKPHLPFAGDTPSFSNKIGLSVSTTRHLTKKLVAEGVMVKGIVTIRGDKTMFFGEAGQKKWEYEDDIKINLNYRSDKKIVEKRVAKRRETYNIRYAKRIKDLFAGKASALFVEGKFRIVSREISRVAKHSGFTKQQVQTAFFYGVQLGWLELFELKYSSAGYYKLSKEFIELWYNPLLIQESVAHVPHNPTIPENQVNRQGDDF